MIHRSSKEQVDEYFAHPSLNQSRLKVLEKGVNLFNEIDNDIQAELFYEEKTHFIIGSGVDCKLTAEPGTFDEIYHISDCPKPSDTIKSIVHMVFDEISRTKADDDAFPETLETTLLEVEIGETALWRAIEFHGYQPNWGAPAKIKKLLEQGSNYYLDLVNAVGKTVISLEEHGLMQRIETSFRNHEIIGNYFVERPDVDIYYQLIIYFQYMGVECKAMLDILEVNHNYKTIEVVDAKTLFDYTVKFPSSMKARRYDLQIRWYIIAVLEWLKQHPELSGYTLLNPAFIVETTKPNAQGNALKFICSNNLMKTALHGRTYYSPVVINDDKREKNYIESYRVKGIKELMELYLWHLENGFEQDKVVVENKGILPLNWEGVG